jgi:nucleotide-binding universal stress UspA family protein
MGKYSRILVAVDGSEESLHALQEAFKLVTSWVTVVAVAPFYEGDLRLVGVPGAERLIREPCDTALARAQELAEAAGAVIQPLCERGEPHERITALAEKGSRDLIVMGARGHSAIERLLVGTVTRRVIGHTDRDVLVVPLQGTVGWDRLLLATDGSPDSVAAADRALDLAQAYGSELLVVAAADFPAGLRWETSDAAAELLKNCQGNVAGVTELAQAARLRVRGFVREGPAYRVITELAAEERANLIVMGTHGWTGLKRLLLGSVTERVIGHAPCPVLVVKS